MTGVMARRPSRTDRDAMMPTTLPLHDLVTSSPQPAGLLPLVDALGPRQALTLRLPAGTALSFLETLTAERGSLRMEPGRRGAVVNVEVMRREAVRGADRGVLEAPPGITIASTRWAAHSSSAPQGPRPRPRRSSRSSRGAS
jgi:hypothetical protein